MNVEVRASTVNPQINLVALGGRLAVETEAEVRPPLMRAIRESPHGVILDLRAVTFVSSAGLRLLLEVYKAAAAAGIKAAMIHPQPEVYKLFKLASLDVTFAVCDNEADALKAVGG